MPKQILLLDQDGPLADFDVHFFKRCGEEGFVLDCEVHEQRHRFATEHIANGRHRGRARQMVDMAGWFADLPVTPGAQDGIELLAEHFDVWICTKPLEANSTCRDDKAFWVKRHFGRKWLEKLILAPNKSLIRGSVLLDDAPKVQWFQRAEWNPVIFDAPYNREGSEWASQPRWSWGHDMEVLFDAAQS